MLVQVMRQRAHSGYLLDAQRNGDLLKLQVNWEWDAMAVEHL